MHLCSRLSTRGESLDLEAAHAAFDELTALLTSPERRYHNLKHIEHCLRELDSARADARNIDHVEAAVWLHDAIYDPRRDDNEACSAVLARRILGKIHASKTAREAIPLLILYTDHRTTPTSPDAMLLVDVDLSILGASNAVFDQYEQGIRAEYGWMIDRDFCLGRRRILQAFLKRDRIYHLDHFFLRYEAEARANLARAIRALG